MNLLLTLLPVYLLGNLHCVGMCGPLVMLLGKHPKRFGYFFGRLTSFTLAGLLAGEAGALIQGALQHAHIAEFFCFVLGGGMIVSGAWQLAGKGYPGQVWIGHRLAGVNQTLSLLLLREGTLPTFLFGFFTIFLPCGQTLLVFSACALAGNAWVGFINGLAFALLTSPALFFAMEVHRLLGPLKKYYKAVVGVAALFVGVLSVCRGLAEIGLIEHCILNKTYHVILF